jgi:hypothetical protein
MWLNGDGLRRRWGQEFAAVLDQLLSVAVGKKSEMSDLDEPAHTRVGSRKNWFNESFKSFGIGAEFKLGCLTSVILRKS